MQMWIKKDDVLHGSRKSFKADKFLNAMCRNLLFIYNVYSVYSHINIDCFYDF